MTSISVKTKSLEDSVRVKVMAAVSPALRVETSEESAILGRTVSTVRVTVLLDSAPSWLLLLDESENLLLSTWMTPLVVLSASGVKVAV